MSTFVLHDEPNHEGQRRRRRLRDRPYVALQQGLLLLTMAGEHLDEFPGFDAGAYLFETVYG